MADETDKTTAVKRFIPVDLSHLGKPTSGLLEKGIPTMERKRKWSGIGGIAEMLGSKGSSYIEETLEKGGTVLEIGGGNLVAAKELAQKPNGRLVVVEPFVDQDDLVGLPEKIKVVAKKLEEIKGEIGLESIDAVYSAGHVLNYSEDKLLFLREVWKLLKIDGRAYIEFFTTPISPSFEQIIEKFDLSEIINVIKLGSEVNVLEIVKVSGKDLNFGSYKLETSIAGNFPGDVNSEYQFKK